MNPIGHYGMFKDAISNRYHDYDMVTFGILIADPRQTDAREYILNYLDVFHRQSGKAFDFFLPGYEEKPYRILASSKFSNYSIRVNNRNFYFNENMFCEFLAEIKNKFGIEYTYNPMLILMSVKPGHLNTAEYIVIELDDNEQHNCRRSGMLFSNIFDIAGSNPELSHIQLEFGLRELRGNALSLLIKGIAPSWLAEIAIKGKELGRYRIRRI